MEDYIPKYIPHNRVVYHWFDVYDLEEKRFRRRIFNEDAGLGAHIGFSPKPAAFPVQERLF